MAVTTPQDEKEAKLAADQAAMEEARAEAAAEAAAGEPELEEPDGQLFIFEEGRRVTLATLIARGTPVEHEIKLTGKAVPGAGDMGLIAFSSPEILLIVPGRAGKVEVDPTYDGDGQVEKVKVRAHIKPTTVYDARSPHGQAALNGE